MSDKEMLLERVVTRQIGGHYHVRVVDPDTDAILAACRHNHRTTEAAWECAEKMSRRVLREAPDA